MALANNLIQKTDRLLARFSPSERSVSKRIATTVGDSLIGRTATSVTDTVLTPQPYVTRLGREHVPGGHAESETMMDSNNKAFLADDYLLLTSVDAISLAELENPGLQFVFTDTSGNKEILRLVDFESPGVNGQDVLYEIYARSVTRP